MARKTGGSSTQKRTAVAGKGLAKLTGPGVKSSVKQQGRKSYPSMDAKARGAAAHSTKPGGGYSMSQGGEGEAKAMNAGNSRMRKGKQTFIGGQQSQRG